MPFEIIKKTNCAIVKVRVEKLDAIEASALKAEFVMLNNQGEKNLIVDMSECDYCDSSGLRSFLVANRLCNDAIGALIIAGLKPDVDTVFRISTLHTVLLITKTVEEAEELLKKNESLDNQSRQ